MGIETEIKCDLCKKAIGEKWTGVEIKIGDRRFWEKDDYVRYKANYSLMVCDDCIGSEIERYNGTNRCWFGIKDYGISLLKRLGILKNI